MLLECQGHRRSRGSWNCSRKEGRFFGDVRRTLRDVEMLERQAGTAQTGDEGSRFACDPGKGPLGPEFLLLLALCTLTRTDDYVFSKGKYSLMFLLHLICSYWNRKHSKSFFYQERKKWVHWQHFSQFIPQRPGPLCCSAGKNITRGNKFEKYCMPSRYTPFSVIRTLFSTAEESEQARSLIPFNSVFPEVINHWKPIFVYFFDYCLIFISVFWREISEYVIFDKDFRRLFSVGFHLRHCQAPFRAKSWQKPHRNTTHWSSLVIRLFSKLLNIMLKCKFNATFIVWEV